MKIDPRIFILSPYVKCPNPNCRAIEYGILDISHNRCTRRCRRCWHKKTFNLPEIKKKVVYIDQFAFSNIVKLLDPNTKGHERTVADPLWKELFELLGVVCALQLVACPNSREHRYESLTSPFDKPLKHTYEHFSCGISFDHGQDIRLRQISALARGWLKNKSPNFDFSPESISSAKLHQWNDRFYITTNFVLEGTESHLRTTRNDVHQNLQRAFESWKAENKSFEEVYALAKAEYSQAHLQLLFLDRQKRADAISMFERGESPDMNDVLPSESEILFITLLSIFQQHLGEEQGNRRFRDFFISGAINNTPFNTISAAMIGSMAVKAARGGQNKPPNQGTANDIRIVSTLLPYCDAMFLDNKSRAILTDIPKRHTLPYPCKLFSPNTSAAFISYLTEIKSAVTADHLKLVEELYGPDAMKPPTGIPDVGQLANQSNTT